MTTNTKFGRKEIPPRPSTRVRLVGPLAMACALVVATDAAAQEAQFGVAPAARTGQALSDPPTEHDRDQDGLYAAVGVAYSQRSDVRRQGPEDEESDSALVITPRAGYRTSFGRHSAEIGATTQFTRFQDFDNEDTSNYTLNALTNLDLSRIVDLGLFASFTDFAEPRGGSGTRLIQDVEPDEAEVLRYGGVFTLGRRESRLQFQAGADRSEWRYQNNNQQFRDRNDDRIHGRVYYNISPRTSLFTGVSLTDVDYIRRADNDLDSEELGYEVGGRWEISAKTEGMVSVGRTEKDFDNPARADAEVTTLAGRLSWAARPRTTFNLYASRQFEETTTLSDDYFVSELIGASVSQGFGSRWNAHAYINQTNDEYDTGREDEILDYGIGLDYALRRWLSLGVEYSIVERDSSEPGFDYEDEILTLFLSSNFELGSR